MNSVLTVSQDWPGAGVGPSHGQAWRLVGGKLALTSGSPEVPRAATGGSELPGTRAMQADAGHPSESMRRDETQSE